MLTSTKNYLKRFLLGMGLYLVTLPLALILARAAGDSPGRFLALAIVLPSVVLVVRAIWRYVIEADELQARQLLESLAIAFAGGSLLTFTWGLAEILGAPALHMIWAMPVYMGCWLVASLVVARRY